MKSFLNALALPIAVLACALASAPTAAAQETLAERKLCSEASEDPKSLLACLKSLNTRISAIEDEPDSIDAPDDTDEKITKLEDELRQARAEIDTLKARVEANSGGDSGSATSASSQVTAPFTVVDGAGATIFAVTGSAGDTKIVAGNGANTVTLSADAASAALSVANGEQSVVLHAGAGLTAVTVDDPAQGKVGVGHIGDGFSGVLFKKSDGGDVFKLGNESAGSVLRLFNNGKAVLAVTSDGSESKLVVSSADDKKVSLSASEGNTAMAAFSGDRSVIVNASSDLTALTAGDPSKGKIGVGFIGAGFNGLVYKDTGDAELLNLGVTEGKGAALRLFANGNPVAAIGSNASESGAGAVFIGNGSGNAVAIASDASSNGSINVFKSGSAAIELRAVDTVIALFENGTPLASLIKSPNSNGGNLVLNSPTGEGVVDAGAASGGGGNVCVTRHNGKTSCLGIGLPGMGIGK